MISPKFYSQILTCQNCEGWGFKENPPEKGVEVCPECEGKGVFLVQSENVYIWDAPTFIDYKSRMRANVVKIIAFFLLILILVSIFIIAKKVFIQLSNLTI
jgi:hypothetical protein